MPVSYFNECGRRIPLDGMRVFGREPSHYYQLTQPQIDYATILQRSIDYQTVPVGVGVSVASFKNTAESIRAEIETSSEFANLLRGVGVPFIFQCDLEVPDLGMSLENKLLPNLQRSFTHLHPQSHFKAVLQGNTELPGHIKLHPISRYEQFLAASTRGPVAGWYFPQALQEFDIPSQRKQMASLPSLSESLLCLSGGMDVCAALTGTPDLLISEEFYAPILCMSSYVHEDERMVLLLKSYGPHMEFWCMTQMLKPDTTQVSEQWAGGITVFRPLR